MAELQKSNISRIVYLLLFLFLIPTTYFCKPPNLNNSSDTNSKAFFENALLLCALGYYQACKPCTPAPGPWGSFVGTPTIGGTFGLNQKTDNMYNLFSLVQTSNDFGSGGINFNGTAGTDTNYLLTRFSPVGERLWFSYIGRRVDRPTGLTLRENDGIYAFATSSIGGLPNPINAHTNNGNNSLITKHSPDGQILWSRYFNDGATAESVIITDIKDSLDQTGLFVFGFLQFPMVNQGTLIGSSFPDSWFIHKINYDGTPIFTKYFPFPADIAFFKPYKILEIPNQAGFYIHSYVSQSIGGSYLGGINSHPDGTSLTPMVMKLDSNLDYQWHLYLGGTASAVDDYAPTSTILTDQSLVVNSLFNTAVPSLGEPYPGGTVNSTIFYRIDLNGTLKYSSFYYQGSESTIVPDFMTIESNQLLVSGTNDTNGFVSILNPTNFQEEKRISGKDLFRASTIKHCDNSFSSLGTTTSAISGAILPFGSGTSNAYLERFKP